MNHIVPPTASFSNEPPSKKRILGGSNRVNLDVGGIKFTSAVTTLSSNSAYFASLLSDNWSAGSSDDISIGIDELFLDQDPIAFGKLLEYMRQGMIDVSDIKKNVLLLAEFLGVEQLLLAVKIRAYRNLHPSLAPMSDCQIASWFDKKYGGIREALSTGVLPGSLTKEMFLQKEFAIMDLAPIHENEAEHELVKINIDVNRGQEPDLEFIHIIGALNWLNHHGYVKHEKQLDTECRDGHTMTFSRTKSLNKNNPSADDIFMPGNEFHLGEQDWRKQFAMLLVDENMSRFIINAPAKFHRDANEHGNLSATAVIEEDGAWLERNRFVDREFGLEEMFRRWLWHDCTMELHFPNSPKNTTSFRIYSRKIECLHRGEMRYVKT